MKSNVTNIKPSSSRFLESSTLMDDADEHYERCFAKCTCSTKCDFPGSLELARSFGRLTQDERIDKLRTILLCLTAPPGVTNELFPSSKRSRKRQRDEGIASSVTTRYCLKGKAMCMNGFLAVVQVSKPTLQRHSKEVGSSHSCAYYETFRKSSREGSTSVQTKVASAFLHRYSELYGMPCPSGRASSNELSLRRLPSTTKPEDVYENYLSQWDTILSSAMESHYCAKRPVKPLKIDSFRAIWREKFPKLKLSCGGSGFCDTCHSLRAALETVDPSDKVHLETCLNAHRDEASSEYQFYRNTTELCRAAPNNDLTHVVFDFAEKVLLPSYRRQPGCLHFITGLKLDLFGASSSNLRTNFVFALPEGHWPNGKTADEVLSMLSYVLRTVKNNEATRKAKHLRLHADNCSGQNKNRYVLFFIFFLVWCGEYESVELCFMVAGHTKNECDSAFGHIKRKFRESDVLTPTDMIRVISQSSCSTTCVPSTSVEWVQWKRVLTEYFKIPSDFRITKYHYFSVRKQSPMTLHVRRLHDSEEHSFQFVKPSNSGISTIVSSIKERRNAKEYAGVWRNLSEVASTHHKTRRAYLEKSITEPLFKNDEVLTSQYFSNGTESD